MTLRQAWTLLVLLGHLGVGEGEWSVHAREGVVFSEWNPLAP